VFSLSFHNQSHSFGPSKKKGERLLWGVGSGEWGVGSREWGVGSGELKSPSPRWGEGWGEGLKPLSVCYRTKILQRNPLPNPPASGRGNIIHLLPTPYSPLTTHHSLHQPMPQRGGEGQLSFGVKGRGGKIPDRRPQRGLREDDFFATAQRTP
jgi:hypothetical protein